MEIAALVIGLIVSLALCELNSAGLGDDLKQRAELTEERTGAGVRTETSSVKCKVQGSTRMPAFSQDGDYIIGGVFSMHNLMHSVKYNYTCKPEPQRCTGRLVHM